MLMALKITVAVALWRRAVIISSSLNSRFKFPLKHHAVSWLDHKMSRDPLLTRLASACASVGGLGGLFVPFPQFYSVYLSLCEAVYLTLRYGIGVCVCVRMLV